MLKGIQHSIQHSALSIQHCMFHQIAIVGCGLIGGSVALALREAWPACRIVAIDRAEVVDAAKRLHAADAGGPELTLAKAADLILLAAPVRQNISVLARSGDVRPRGRNRDRRREYEARDGRSGASPAPTTAIHRRPSARRGGDRGHQGRPPRSLPRPALDSDAQRENRDAEAVERLSDLASAVGAQPRIMDPIAHDRLMAYLSHLPQLTVSALMQVVGERVGRDGLSLAGTGLRDTTRLASSPADHLA